MFGSTKSMESDAEELLKVELTRLLILGGFVSYLPSFIHCPLECLVLFCCKMGVNF